MTTARSHAPQSIWKTANPAPGFGASFRGSAAGARAVARRASHARPATVGSRLRRRLLSRWSVTTSLALSAVFLIFVDVMLTVEVQGVSLRAHELRKRMQIVSMELGALESLWASRSSHVELDAKATLLGLSVPSQDHVVLLPSTFLEEAAPGGPPETEELCHEFLKGWARISAMGIP